MLNKTHMAKIILLIVLVLFISLFLSYIFIYEILDLPRIMPCIISYMIAFILCLVIFTVFCFSILTIHSFKYNHKDRYINIYTALEQITSGNFDILIDANPSINHKTINDLTTSINKMAKELKSMEMMRIEFVSNVSHEIQSPLTSIKGFTILLKDENLSNEEKVTYLEIIEMESNRLSKLTENLLRLSALDSKSKALEFSFYSLDQQIKNIILFMEPQWQKKSISFNLDCHLTQITGDKDLLSQVWINLISNAIKFSSNNDEISITILTAIKNTIKVTVKDNGIGINVEDQRYIFNRFFMANKSRKRDLGGNGLGLSISKKIVDMHHGNITVHSKLNEGTTFIVSLPQCP
jgi:two-component system, OmpR family, phosphate regulon sensor histidine kinase PhoR